MMIKMIKVQGFTLVEAMIAMTILVILVSSTTSSFIGAITRNKDASGSLVLKKHIEQMRNHAISSGQSVVMCPSKDAKQCGRNWSEGWLVYVDMNRNFIFDEKGGDELLLVEQNAIPEGLSASIQKDWFAFNYMGLPSEPVSFWSCKSAAMDEELLNVTAAGHIHTESNKQVACNG